MFGLKKIIERIDVLEEECKSLRRMLKAEEKRRINGIERLERIIRHSRDDGPTVVVHTNGRFSTDVYVRMYIDKEEYEVELRELCGFLINRDSAKFEVKDGLGVFSIMTRDFVWIFTIDYKKGTYVYSRKKKEETECTDC